MSKPLTSNALHPLSFEGRLLLVQAAIQQRIQQEPTINPNHLRARLWGSWLKKNVLELPTKREVQA